MPNDMKRFMAAMNKTTNSGSTISSGRRLVCGFGYIASSGEDARAAEAFAAAFLNALSMGDKAVVLNQDHVIDGECDVIPSTQTRLR